MRVFLQITLCCFLAGGAMAQRGGHGGGGGFRGASGGFRGAGGFSGGGFHGGGIGYGGGYVGGGYRGYGGYRGFGYVGYGGFYGSYYWPYGYGYSYWPGYFDYSYPVSYSYPYSSSYAGSYPVYTYDPSPNVTVIYPAQSQPAAAPAYVQSARPVMRTYDEYGQEVHPAPEPRTASGNASPIYLVALKDHVIRAAASYWVDGKTLHYVTLQHEEKQVPLDSVDRDLSLQLNRERRVTFQLPTP